MSEISSILKKKGVKQRNGSIWSNPALTFRGGAMIGRKPSPFTGVRGLAGSVNVRQQNQKGKARRRSTNGMWQADGSYFGQQQNQRDIAAASRFAEEILNKLKREGKLSEEAKTKEGHEVLKEVVTIVIAKRSDDPKAHVHSVGERLKAASIALPYLIPKPESSTKVTVQTAEDFLLGVAGAETE